MKHFIIAALCLILIFVSCKKDPIVMEAYAYDTTPYAWNLPGSIAPPPADPNNPMTVTGVELGRHLFYETMLSRDNTISCASCHQQECAFTDCNQALSKGVDGTLGTRNSMSLVNLAWVPKLNWDGSALSLPMQHIQPVIHPLEMKETWANVESKLQADMEYPNRFYTAFGSSTITQDRTTKAIAQFIRSITSHNSEFDKYQRGENLNIDNDITDGESLVVQDRNQAPNAIGCTFHCHSNANNFTNNQFMDNGIDTFCGTQFVDLGHGPITGNASDNGKFRVPSLRNIAVTGPYMHDGRFATLREVLEFYDTGIKVKPCLDPVFTEHGAPQLNMDPDDFEKVLKWMESLTDHEMLNNPAYASPF